MAELLLVYGTLKQMARSRNGRAACIPGRLWDNGSYPALELVQSRDTLVAGLVFEVSAEELQRLDAYEGVAHGWYRRVRIVTTAGAVVWAYVGEGCLAGAGKPGSRWRLMKPGKGDITSWEG